MKYIIEHSCDTKEVGYVSWGQTELTNPYSADELLDKGKKIKTISVRMHKRAKLTDMLSCFRLGISNNFIISKQLRTILEDFKIQPHLFVDCNVEKPNGDILKYSVLHFKGNQFSEIVDFKKSIFRITYTISFPLKGNEPIIEINNYSDFMQKEKELDSQGLIIRLDKYVINEEYKDKYDVYTFFPFDSGVFISKELRDVIVDNNLTGLKIIEVD
jgi:hypothetical protein